MQYVYLRYPEGKYKAVTLSYDDGCYDDMRFSDVITPAGLKCTFNLTNHSGLTPDQVETYILDRGRSSYKAFHKGGDQTVNRCSMGRPVR